MTDVISSSSNSNSDDSYDDEISRSSREEEDLVFRSDEESGRSTYSQNSKDNGSRSLSPSPFYSDEESHEKRIRNGDPRKSQNEDESYDSSKISTEERSTNSETRNIVKDTTNHTKATNSKELQAQHSKPKHASPNGRCKSIAILGTMSDAGKSVVTAGLCRLLSNNGVRVAPFKAQNMSNNASPALLPDPRQREKLYQSFQAAVGTSYQQTPRSTTEQGYGEIGTAQALQAEACRLIPRVEMNPVLLKSGGKNSKGEYLCSVVVLGKQVIRETYGELNKRTTSLRSMVLESHAALAEGSDVIILEGAGSCTELNLIDRDIVNLPLVRELKSPWLLVANIDCGGVVSVHTILFLVPNGERIVLHITSVSSPQLVTAVCTNCWN